MTALRFLRGRRVVEPDQRFAIDAFGQDREVALREIDVESIWRSGRDGRDFEKVVIRIGVDRHVLRRGTIAQARSSRSRASLGTARSRAGTPSSDSARSGTANSGTSGDGVASNGIVTAAGKLGGSGWDGNAVPAPPGTATRCVGSAWRSSGRCRGY